HIVPLFRHSQCSFFTCRHYEYHFIGENKTWKEAQSFCRENYTDLAKVYDMTDMKRLLDSVKNQTEAWIGLYSEPGNKRMWHWSLPGVEHNESEAKWENRDRNDEHCKNCVRMNRDQKWKTSKCHEEKIKFVCYNGENMQLIFLLFCVFCYACSACQHV
uniref:C-type lectin domain-containing protein n=1 Tax=Seriola lalandi dorsalis TaxID=1841481 RepID=A0A3B4WS46_SERLL